MMSRISIYACGGGDFHVTIINKIFSEIDKEIGMSCGTNVALASPDPLCFLCL